MRENTMFEAGDQAEVELLRSAERDMLTDFDRAYRIFHDMIGSFRRLHDLGPAVTVYGSARLREGHEYYELARAMGGELAKAGFSVMPATRPRKSLTGSGRTPTATRKTALRISPNTGRSTCGRGLGSRAT